MLDAHGDGKARESGGAAEAKGEVDFESLAAGADDGGEADFEAEGPGQRQQAPGAQSAEECAGPGAPGAWGAQLSGLALVPGPWLGVAGQGSAVADARAAPSSARK